MFSSLEQTRSKKTKFPAQGEVKLIWWLLVILLININLYLSSMLSLFGQASLPFTENTDEGGGGCTPASLRLLIIYICSLVNNNKTLQI